MGEGENAGFSNTIPLFKKTLKMTLHKQRKSTAEVEQSKRSLHFYWFLRSHDWTSSLS